MRQPRILRQKCSSTYHCVSRIIDKRTVIGDDEKNFFHHWMRRLEAFSGVRVLTYCLMSNHFHLLVRVPCKDQQENLTEARLRGFLPLLYRGRQLDNVRQELDRAAAAASQTGDDRWLGQILARYDARRHDLSSFLKDLKQRFSQWYNQRQERSGHLWESAFRSVLVEDGEKALLTMAAYIDLNPIRAGLCSDPADYGWSGYGEASGAIAAGRGKGSLSASKRSENRKCARRRLVELLQHTRASGSNQRVTWADINRCYREMLYAHGEERPADPRSGAPSRRGLSRAAVDAVLGRGGKIPLAAALLCRVRYFSEGGVIGGEEFVNEVIDDQREERGTYFRDRRGTGALEMAQAAEDWDNLKVLRKLRGPVIG